MYIAQKTADKHTHYVLRESCPVGNTLSYRNLFQLGQNPSEFVIYPGGNAYYISEEISEALEAMGVQYNAESLDDLFWPFVKPDIRHATDHFRHRSKRNQPRPKLTDEENELIHRSIHPFDKRRMHFLRFGDMDQGPATRMPQVLMKRLLGKCRDEIEQHFIKAEKQLKTKEFKSYVYTAFDLQRFFPNIIAKKMPQGLDQVRVEALFLEEICRVNDTLFDDPVHHATAGMLNEYLKRYLFMFFDYEYADSTLLNDYVRDFIYRRHFYHSPVKEKMIPFEKAERIFNIGKDALKTMTRKDLTRKYRILAHKVHPDKGGTHEQFVELNKAYESLLRTIGHK